MDIKIEKGTNEDFNALKGIVGAIETIFTSAAKARQFPAAAMKEADSICLSNGAAPYLHYDTLKRAKEIMKDEARATGEANRKKVLEALSLELESLRVLPPPSAAKAAVSLGCTARSLKQEAS